MRRQRHGLPAGAVASVAGGKAPRAVLPSDAAMVSDGHARRGAAAIVQPMPRSCHRLRGVHAPRLGRERVEASSAALWGRAGLGRPRPPPRTQGGAGVEGRKARAAADRAPGVDGKEATRLGGEPACPMLRQCAPWHPPVSVAMGSAGLLPRLPAVAATAWAAQRLAAARAQGLAGSPPAQGEEGALVGQAECLERMRARQDAGAIRPGQERGLAVCAPRRLGPGVPLGAGAMAACVLGIALHAARGPRCGVAPACRGTTDEDSVPPRVMARRHPRGGAVGRTLGPQDGGTVPRRSAWGLPRRLWGTTGGGRRHAVTPAAGTGYRHRTAERTDGAPWPGAAGGWGASVAGARGSAGRAGVGGCAGPPQRPREVEQRSAAGEGGRGRG
jgi:hypothetical protein